MKKIRVLEMIDRPFLGGGQIVLLSLARHLDRERFEVAVCAAAGGPLEDEVRRLGFVFHPAAFSKKPSLGLLRGLECLLVENRIGLLHTHGGVAGLFGRWAAHRAGTPAVIHTLHGIHYLHYRNRLIKNVYIRLERRCSKFTDAVICVSEADRTQALRHRLADESRIRLIRNGIETTPPRSGPAWDRRLLELQRKLNLDRPIVGAVARLHRQKGVSYLFRAAETILLAHPEAKIVVVGGGPLETEFRAMTAKEGFGRSVAFLGERADASEILALFDVFVLPSLWEGLPLALVEAAAAGKPIVATDIDGVREVVRNGETGLLVPPRDSAALAAAVLRLLDDPDLAGRLAGRARAEVPPLYTVERMVSETASLYLEIAARKGIVI
jgi:glycosyltransferase involved in cell wall biosynthesis